MKTVFGKLKKGEDLLILESGVMKDSGFICVLSGELFKETRSVVKVRYVKLKDLNKFLVGEGASSLDEVSQVGSVDFETLKKSQEAIDFLIDSTLTFTMQFLLSTIALLNSLANVANTLFPKISKIKSNLLELGVTEEELNFYERYPQVLSIVSQVLSLVSKDYNLILSLFRKTGEV